MARAGKKKSFWGKKGGFHILLQCVFWLLVWHFLEISCSAMGCAFLLVQRRATEIHHWWQFVLKHLVTEGGFIIDDTSSEPSCPTQAELKHWGYFTVLKVSAPYLTLLSQKLSKLMMGGLSCSVFCPYQRCHGSCWTALGIFRAAGCFYASLLHLLCSFCSAWMFLCFPQVALFPLCMCVCENWEFPYYFYTTMYVKMFKMAFLVLLSCASLWISLGKLTVRAGSVSLMAEAGALFYPKQSFNEPLTNELQ